MEINKKYNYDIEKMVESTDYKIGIKCCPYCKSDYGFYIEEPYKGSFFFEVGFDNASQGSHRSESEDYFKPKKPRCRSCHKSLARWIKEE